MNNNSLFVSILNYWEEKSICLMIRLIKLETFFHWPLFQLRPLCLLIVVLTLVSIVDN